LRQPASSAPTFQRRDCAMSATTSIRGS
jgi:hypothetical protein